MNFSQFFFQILNNSLIYNYSFFINSISNKLNKINVIMENTEEEEFEKKEIIKKFDCYIIENNELMKYRK